MIDDNQEILQENGGTEKHALLHRLAGGLSSSGWVGQTCFDRGRDASLIPRARAQGIVTLEKAQFLPWPCAG